MKGGSLTARVLLFASVWAVIALVAIAIVISQLYRAGSERAFADLLRAHLNSVINAVIDQRGGQAGRQSATGRSGVSTSPAAAGSGWLNRWVASTARDWPRSLSATRRSPRHLKALPFDRALSAHLSGHGWFRQPAGDDRDRG
jgi:hypothetical protein